MHEDNAPEPERPTFKLSPNYQAVPINHIEIGSTQFDVQMMLSTTYLDPVEGNPVVERQMNVFLSVDAAQSLVAGLSGQLRQIRAEAVTPAEGPPGLELIS